MRKGLAAAGVVALITAGSAACGSDSPGSPQDKVGKAFQKLGDQNTVTVDLGFTGTSDEIYTALKDEEDFTKADAELLASLHVTVGGSSHQSLSLLGKSLGKGDTAAGKDSSAVFLLSTDGASGKDLFEVRTVGQKVYLRADVKGLEKLDPDPSDSDGIKQFNEQYLDALTTRTDSIGAAAQGKWISLDPAVWNAFIKSALAAQGKDTTSTATPQVSRQTAEKLVTGLRAAVTKDVTFTDGGKKDGAQHVLVGVPARQFAKDVVDQITPVLKQVPSLSQSDLDDLQDVSGVPNKKVTADIAVKDGTVSSITFDIAQLDSQSQGPLPLRLTFKGTGKAIGAPSGAVSLNPQDVVSAVMEQIHGSGDDSDSSLF